MNRNLMGMGWPETGSLSDLPDSREAFRERVDAVYPELDAVARSARASQLFRLVREIRTGDYVAFFHGERVHLGVVAGEYAFDGNTAECIHSRPVRWLKRDVSRNSFSREALREAAASPMPLFLVKRYAGEFFAAMGVPFLENVGSAGRAVPSTAHAAEKQTRRTPSVEAAKPAPAETAVNVPAAAAAPVGTAAEPVLFSEETVHYVLEKLDAVAAREKLPEFAAALLRAMGYRTETVEGDTFTAQRDELLPPMRVSAGRDGLRVVTAGTVRRVEGRELAELVLRHYGALEARFQEQLPLRLAYVPAAETDGNERRTDIRRS